MLNRIASVIGWIGTALVVRRRRRPDVQARVGAVRLLRRPGPAWSCVAALHGVSQWREVGRRRCPGGRRGWAPSRGTSVVVVLALLVAVNYLASRRNKRWDLTANQQFSLSARHGRSSEAGRAAQGARVRPAGGVRSLPRSAERVSSTCRSRCRSTTSTWTSSRSRRPRTRCRPTAPWSSTTRAGPNASSSSDEQQLTNGLIKVITGKQRKVYFLQGHGEKDTASSERTGYSAIAAGLQSDNFTIDTLVLAQQRSRAGRRLRRRGCRADDGPVAAGDRGAEEVPRRRAASSSLLVDPPAKVDATRR